MKKTFGLILIGAAACIFQSCIGDHGANAGEDTVRQIMGGYDARKIAVDTGRITTATGSASLLESAGSGGTSIQKDTAKHTYYTGKPATAVSTVAPADSSKSAKPDSTTKK